VLPWRLRRAQSTGEMKVMVARALVEVVAFSETFLLTSYVKLASKRAKDPLEQLLVRPPLN
jgi:hypothetical protein